VGDIKTLIEEYSNETKFWRQQTAQWQGLVTAILLDRADQEASDFRITEEALEAAVAYITDARLEDGIVTVTLAKASDGS